MLKLMNFFLRYAQQKKAFSVFNLRKQTTIESPLVTFDESSYAINPPSKLIGDDIFGEYEHHHIDIGAHHASTSKSVETILQDNLSTCPLFYYTLPFTPSLETHVGSSSCTQPLCVC